MFHGQVTMFHPPFFSARNTIRLGKSPRVCQTAEEALEPHLVFDREMLKISPSHSSS